MGRRIGFAVLGALVGYALGAFSGGYLISIALSNTHDRSVEAAMTGAFVTGPLVALIGFVVAFVRTRRS